MLDCLYAPTQYNQDVPVVLWYVLISGTFEVTITSKLQALNEQKRLSTQLILVLARIPKLAYCGCKHPDCKEHIWNRWCLKLCGGCPRYKKGWELLLQQSAHSIE